MNANELANELERPNNYQQENNFTTQAATMLRQQQEQIKEKDVCLKLLHDRITHLNKMVVYYQDISMSGTHSEEYEEGFWDAVDFVRKAQEK